MSAKRPSHTDSKPKSKASLTEPRQFKQTKLNFGSAFPSAPQQQRKKAKISEEESKQDATAYSSLKLSGTPQEESSKAAKSPKAEDELAASAEAPTQTTPTTPTPRQRQIRITDKAGDLFDAPPNSVLIHACNAIGSWGGGIALAFRERYPDAYGIYSAHCKRSLPQRLVGTALLIAPRVGARRQHYVGCLFTSKRYGRAKDSPEMILRATGPAMRDLLRQIARERGIGDIRMCRINSGLFAVPWGESRRAIEGLQLEEEEIPNGLPVEIAAYSPD